MNTIKQVNSTKLKLNGKKYRGYTVCDIPKRFGYIYKAETDTDGIYQWFNYKGLTWLPDTSSKKSFWQAL
jgi:hypothetical protein